MDASYKIKTNAENSIVQHFGDVSANKEEELFTELEELKSRAGQAGSAWNLDEILDVMKRLILSDKQKLKSMKADLKKEEAELEKNKKKLALAKDNNSFLEKRDKFEKEKEELEKRRTEIDEKIFLLDKQKRATRSVKPSYDGWTKKCSEVSRTQEQMKAAESNLEAALCWGG